MAKHYFPAVFRYDNKAHTYLVSFPDIDGCCADGKTIQEAFEHAESALGLMLWSMEENKETVPTPSDPENIEHSEKSFLAFIDVDTIEYRKKVNNKSIKKTLSIPEWLNTLAIESNINFSSVLQEALKVKLGI